MIDHELGNIFGPNLRDGGMHVIGGSIKGFLMYLIPISIIRRRFKGNIRRALAFAVFVGGVRFVDMLIRLYCRFKQNGGNTLEHYIRKFHMMIAGGLGGFVSLLIDSSLYKSSTFLFWCLVRALRCYIPSVPYGSLILLCLTASQILSTWILYPHQLDPSYLKFLNKHGGKTKEQMKQLLTRPEIPCSIVHGDTHCIKAAIDYFPSSFMRAVKVYVPVYIVMLLFAKRRNLKHLLMNIIRSSLFLSLYCTTAWSSACLYYNKIRPKVTRTNLFLHTWTAGIPVLIERESRRKEFAAYCSTYALDSLYRWAVDSKVIKEVPIINLILMSITAAIMLHNHNQQPAILMKWLFKISE